MGTPDRLWIVRHAESAGNVARVRAETLGEREIRLGVRDVDVPLSELGERQADALGRWFRSLPDAKRPTAILTSPYRRASQTAARLLDSEELDRIGTVSDERLREREFGVLDGLTRAGIEARFPEEASRRGPLGKFYYRPPGGESWCDVILRLRSVIGTLSREYTGERVVVVAHTVVVLCLRYLLEGLDEDRLLEIDRAHEVANCSITSYVADPSAGRTGMALERYNFVAPLEEHGAPVTAEPDAHISA